VIAIVPGNSTCPVKAVKAWLQASAPGDAGRAVMALTADQRRALMMLADAGAPGVLEKLLVDVHCFGLADLAALVHAGLATVGNETMRASGRKVSMTKLCITDAGRQALATRH
jgi:hypothetical protein